ncbi:MAG: TonB-dependent receptor [Betaproteobacteria bacterium]|nr:TonB-dependent receptor [Betaproteobacteria bacterium]
MPATTESVTRAQMAETINVMNTEDALKYLPSLIVRKRNFGDQQAPLATRTSGLGQSARSLIYADGFLLSSLIGNNNGSASPRWALVSPEEIERIDVMYGPFSAAYPGNSMGAVVEITTRMPQKLEAGAKVQGASQGYSLYGTSNTYNSKQYSGILGNRTGDLSWWLSANHLDSQTQPLAIITALATTPSAAGAPTTGGILDKDRLGRNIAVIGAGGIERKQQETLKAKVAYDFNAEWRAAYSIGFFQNAAKSRVETYLRDAAGNPVFSGADLNIGGFRFTGGGAIGATAFSSASGIYNVAQEHTAQSVSLKSSMQREWDWEAVVSSTRFGLDTTRFPGFAAFAGNAASANALPGAVNGGAGTLQSLDGTGWYTADLKGNWRPQGTKGAHQLSFGLHTDRYTLASNTSTTADWISGGAAATTAQSQGKTSTHAIWIQDAWRFAPQWKLTLGGRQEYWRARDGFNYATNAASSSTRIQPGLDSSKFSPKASLAWEANRDWRVTASYGTAYRFPTVTELYQAVNSGATIVTPNPSLRPERAYSGELAVERAVENSRVRVSLFQENLSDALIAQNSTIPGSTLIASSTQNIDRIRSRGVELVAEKGDALIRGLDLSGSMTFVDSKILSDPNFRNIANVLADVTGKFTPNIPRFKATAVATYRHDEHWSSTLAARYSARVWATVDNTDINPNTYQGFDHYFVVDARVRYQFHKQLSAALGVENLFNHKYFLFHPFPQRTVVVELKFAL